MQMLRLPGFVLALVLAVFSAGAWSGDIHWIDVRTAEEFAGGHVEGALNVPYDEIGDRIGAVELQKDDTIYLYCGSGRRAGIAKETLETMGYTGVTNVGGLEEALKLSGERAGD